MLITEIQRFSLKDGPGIRTVVFLKGCNMACAWCHNPETINPKPQLLCYPENCIGCGMCAEKCFADALVMSGREMTADEVYTQIAFDIPYYKNSGGGVTLSGGEVLTQAESALELLKKCREQKIHTAFESNLYSPWETIEELLSATDLVMADIKHMDSDTHKKYTGVPNETILKNIRLLDDSGIPFIIRTPVIPGVNDAQEDISAAGRFLSGFKNLLCYELLNFNPLGAHKYNGLKAENIFADTKPLDDEKMEELANAARSFGVKVRCG